MVLSPEKNPVPGAEKTEREEEGMMARWLPPLLLVLLLVQLRQAHAQVESEYHSHTSPPFPVSHGATGVWLAMQVSSLPGFLSGTVRTELLQPCWVQCNTVTR